LIDIGLGIIKITKISMGRSDASGLTLINAALPEECAHVTVAVNVKYLEINIAAGGPEVAGTI
jgi:hypothetical protein